MDKLPLDVWDDIFHFACTDGGRTGAALASTSSGIRAASAAHRFYSLKLTSLAQIGRLLLCLERIQRMYSPRLGGRNTAIPNTRHLLLSFFPEDCESLVRPWRGWRAYSTNKSKRELQVAEDERAWLAAKGAWDRQFLYVVPELFRLIAPTLETLAVLQHPGIPLPYVRSELFNLRELALLADDGIFVQPPVLWDDRERRKAGYHDHAGRIVPFPSLTHLHIVFEGAKQHSWEKTLPLWAGLAPAMTHLRVSQASNLIPEVLEAMSTRSRTKATPEFRAALSHPSLRKIVIQPLTMQPVRGHEHLHEVNVLSGAPRGKGKSRIVVLRGRWYRDGYWRDRLRWEWEDRMLGKAGCWAECEEDEGEWTHERRKRTELAAEKAKQKGASKATGGQLKDLIRLDNPDHTLRVWRSGFFRRSREKLQHGRSASL